MLEISVIIHFVNDISEIAAYLAIGDMILSKICTLWQNHDVLVQQLYFSVT